MATPPDLEKLTVEELLRMLTSKKISDDTLDSFMSNGIDGETFVAMTDDDLKEIVPMMCDRIKLRKLQNDMKTPIQV